MSAILDRRTVDNLSEKIDAGEYIPRGLLRDLVYTARVWHEERKALARLSAETPQFSNPLAVWETQALRDRILAPTQENERP